MPKKIPSIMVLLLSASVLGAQTITIGRIAFDLPAGWSVLEHRDNYGTWGKAGAGGVGMLNFLWTGPHRDNGSSLARQLPALEAALTMYDEIVMTGNASRMTLPSKIEAVGRTLIRKVGHKPELGNAICMSVVVRGPNGLYYFLATIYGSKAAEDFIKNDFNGIFGSLKITNP